MTRRHRIRHGSIKAPHRRSRKNVNRRNGPFLGASRRRSTVSHDERKSPKATARLSRKYCVPTTRRVVRRLLPRAGLPHEEIPSRNGADLRRVSRNGNLKNTRRRQCATPSENRGTLLRYATSVRRGLLPVPPHRDREYPMRARSRKRNSFRIHLE